MFLLWRSSGLEPQTYNENIKLLLERAIVPKICSRSKAFAHPDWLAKLSSSEIGLCNKTKVHPVYVYFLSTARVPRLSPRRKSAVRKVYESVPKGWVIHILTVSVLLIIVYSTQETSRKTEAQRPESSPFPFQVSHIFKTVSFCSSVLSNRRELSRMVSKLSVFRR